MAQSQKPTTQGYGETGKMIAGETATEVAKVVCYEGTCTAASESSTYASPAAAKSTKSGFTVVAADTVVSSQTTVANDTVELDHEFTAGEDATITGFGTCNNESTPDVLYAECCFNAGVALETSDTLTIEMKMQYKLGS